MELGKLTDYDDGGTIFYFVVDDEYPNDPRPEQTRTFYVVSRSCSYIDAFYFLCKSLCSDNMTQLELWHALYERLFGSIAFSTFLANVKESPKWDFSTGRVVTVSSNDHEIAGFFRDETSARLCLHALVNQENSPVEDRRKSRRLKRQNSATPQKSPEGFERVPSPMMQRKLNFLESTNSLKESEYMNLSSIRAVSPNTGTSLEAHAWRTMYEKLQRETESQFQSLKKDIGQLKKELQKEKEVNMELTSRPSTRWGPNSATASDVGHMNAAMVSPRFATGSYTETLPPYRPVTALPVAPANAADTAAAGNYDVDHRKFTHYLTNEQQETQELVQSLRNQLKEKETALVKQKEELRKEINDREKKIKDLERALQDSRKNHSDRLCNLVLESKQAAAKLEENIGKKEEELRKVYENLLQTKDVKIAQLTEQLIQVQKQQTKLNVELQDYDDMKAHVKEWEKCHNEAKIEYEKVVSREKECRSELSAALTTIERQKKELLEAGYLIENLKGGLEMVRSELPYIWNEVHRNIQAVK